MTSEPLCSRHNRDVRDDVTASSGGPPYLTAGECLHIRCIHAQLTPDIQIRVVRSLHAAGYRLRMHYRGRMFIGTEPENRKNLLPSAHAGHAFLGATRCTHQSCVGPIRFLPVKPTSFYLRKGVRCMHESTQPEDLIDVRNSSNLDFQISL